MAPSTFDLKYATRLASVIVKSLGYARWLIEVEGVGTEVREIMDHIRDLYGLLLSQADKAPGAVADQLRGACVAIGNHLTELEELLEPEGDDHMLH